MRKLIVRTGLVHAVLALALAPGAASAETRIQDVYEGRATVIDADGLRIRGNNIRLWGVDGPEYDQVCLKDRQAFQCGRDVSQHLRTLIGRSVVRCEYRDWNEGQLGLYAPRAVARCTVRGIDIADWLVSRGYAVPFYVPQYVNAGRQACNAGLGLWSGAWSEPSAWRIRREGAGMGLGRQSGRSCQQAFREMQTRMDRYNRHRPRGL